MKPKWKIKSLMVVALSASWLTAPTVDAKLVYESHCLETYQRLQSRSYLTVGYGQAREFTLAKQQALDELATSLHVQVKVDSEVHQHVNQAEAQVSLKQHSSLTTSQALQGATQVCRDNTDPTGAIHLVYKLDRRPSQERLAAQLAASFKGAPPKTIVWQAPKVVAASPSARWLKKRLSNSSAGDELKRLPLTIRPLPASLWQVSAGEAVVDIPSHEIMDWLDLSTLTKHGSSTEGSSHPKGSLLKLDIFVKGEGGKLQQKGNRLKEGDLFRFHVHGNLIGFVTIFNLYSDGRVAQLTESKAITPGNTTYIPPKGVFDANLLAPGQAVQDWYIAVHTDQPIHDARFRQLQDGAGILTTTSRPRLMDFLYWLAEIESLSVASILVETTPEMVLGEF